MNKLYASLLVVGLGISAYAATSTPIGTTDKQAYPQPNYSGVKTCEISIATPSFTGVLCTNNTPSSATPSTAPVSGIVLQIIGSSLTASSDYLTFRDTSTNSLVPATAAIYSQGSQSTPVGGVILFRFKNGLNVTDSATLGTAGQWTIIYTTDIY